MANFGTITEGLLLEEVQESEHAELTNIKVTFALVEERFEVKAKHLPEASKHADQPKEAELLVANFGIIINDLLLGEVRESEPVEWINIKVTYALEEKHFKIRAKHLPEALKLVDLPREVEVLVVSFGIIINDPLSDEVLVSVREAWINIKVTFGLAEGLLGIKVKNTRVISRALSQ